MDDDVFEVQRLYPQIYLACHVDHVRAASTKWRISSQDGSILMHLDLEVAMSPDALAKHLGVAASTLSAAIARLSKLGYLSATPNQTDKRRRELRLTKRGAEAIAVASVLDAGRVRALLMRLSPADRKLAVHGLRLLVKAARAKSESN